MTSMIGITDTIHNQNNWYIEDFKKRIAYLRDNQDSQHVWLRCYIDKLHCSSEFFHNLLEVCLGDSLISCYYHVFQLTEDDIKDLALLDDCYGSYKGDECCGNDYILIKIRK